jgi:putative SOS response-associated peptidase YedK
MFSTFGVVVMIAPSEAMTCWPVSARVGNVKNNDPSVIEPITLH